MQRLSEIRLNLPPVVDGRIARYRERVDRVRGDVEGADIDTLIRCHDRLLSIAPHIRVGTKWGRYTTYTVKIKDRDAVALTAGALKLRGHGADNHRIEFGANAKGEPHARLEFWEPAPVHDWDTWDDPEVPARVWEWLDTYQPAARILLDIDNHLLRLQLANAVSRPPPLSCSSWSFIALSQKKHPYRWENAWNTPRLGVIFVPDSPHMGQSITRIRAMQEKVAKRLEGHIDMARFGAAIRAKRGGRSLRIAAEETGISWSRLATYERGEDQPGLGHFIRLCRWIDVPMEYFTETMTLPEEDHHEAAA